MYRVLVDGRVFCDSRDDELAIIDPIVTLEGNKAGSFEFVIPPEHPLYDLILRRTSIISVYRDNDEQPLFQGICVEESVDFFKQKTIICEGELTYLNDSILRPQHYSQVPVRDLLVSYIEQHNAQVEEQKQFEVGDVDVVGQASCYTNMNPTLQEIKEDLVDDFGGVIIIRYADGKRYIDYKVSSAHDAVQPIVLGENLTDYKSNIDNTEIATRVIPLGAILDEQEISGLDKRLDIKSVNNGLDYIENAEAVARYGIITKTVIYDGVTTPENLKRKGQDYLNNIQFEDVVVEVNAIDFGYLMGDVSKFRLLDNVHIISHAHGMDRWLRLNQMTINLNNPERDSFTLGIEEKLSLSALTNQRNGETVALIEERAAVPFMEKEIGKATTLITGNVGGYVVLHADEDGKPFELLLMDTEDIETAVNVWRWNKNGLGFSSTGYDGPYGTAITQDGRIVADYITAGTLRGISIISNNATITGGSINIETLDDTSSIITLKSGMAHIKMRPTILELKNGTSNGNWSGGFIVLNDDNGHSTRIGPTYMRIDGELVLTQANISKYIGDVVHTSDLPTATVGFATSAGTANNAQSADYATRADTADYADRCKRDATDFHNPNTFIYDNDSATNHRMIYRITDGSSKRWKHDIGPITDENLNPHRLYDLPVVQFVYNEDFIKNQNNQIGFIAEDVDEIFPFACEYDPNDKSAINWIYKNMIPPMLSLIQEQKKLLDDLTKRVEALEKGAE